MFRDISDVRLPVQCARCTESRVGVDVTTYVMYLALFHGRRRRWSKKNKVDTSERYA